MKEDTNQQYRRRERDFIKSMDKMNESSEDVLAVGGAGLQSVGFLF